MQSLISELKYLISHEENRVNRILLEDALEKIEKVNERKQRM